MNDRNNYYEHKLREDFPNLEFREVKVIGSGWHHDAVRVDDTIVFRIPRGIHQVTLTVENEVAILNALKGKLPVQIPNPLYVAPGNEYFGYPLVKGVLLKDLVEGLEEADWSNLKEDWVNIASSIHSAISVIEGRQLGIPDFIESGPSPAERIFGIEGIEQAVLDFASRTIKKSNELDLSNLHFMVIHNDLQFHNIIADPETKRITGLIDWTDACVGPIAREFAIGEWMKTGLLEEVASLYEQKTGMSVDVEEARMWRSLEELGDYVETLEAGDFEDAEATMNRIRNMISLEL